MGSMQFHPEEAAKYKTARFLLQKRICQLLKIEDRSSSDCILEK